MRIIFLDIDGVLNHCDTVSAALVTDAEPLPLPIEPACMSRLNRLVAETGAKIVISSSWRLFAPWQDLGAALVRQGLVADVVGGTPDLVADTTWRTHWLARRRTPFLYDRLERGWEIQEWLARFAEGVCSCGHERDLHASCYEYECTYIADPSGMSGCRCRQFDGSPLTGFVILDDVSDMDALRPWLVLTDPTQGLADPDVERAKWLLERSVDGITRAREQALGTRSSGMTFVETAVCRGCGHRDGEHEPGCRVIEQGVREQLQTACDHRSEYGTTRTTGDPLGPPCCGRCGLELPTKTAEVPPSSAKLPANTGDAPAAEAEGHTDTAEAPRVYTRRCGGYVYFADQGIEVCEECGGCTCCDHVDVDHREARYRCLLSREGNECLLVGNANFDHDCVRDSPPFDLDCVKDSPPAE